MRKLVQILSAALFSLPLLSNAQAEPVHFTTEEYPLSTIATASSRSAL